MSLFKTKTIEEVTDTLIDYRGKTPTKTKTGIKLITAKVIKDGFIADSREHEYISEDYYDDWMRRGLPQQWDILITTEAPLGEVAQIRTLEKVALAQRVILLRGKKDVIDQAYFFQVLKSPFVRAELSQRATGTTVIGIKQSELRKVRIPYYPLPTQRRIAAVLSAYDDLIENNQRRIAILEEMARSLYREWFVELRFPGHEGVEVVEHDGVRVPAGWELAQLNTLARVNNEIIKRGREPFLINYVDIASVSPGRIDKIDTVKFSDAPGRARRIVRHGDTIWSTVRPNRRSYSLILNPSIGTIVSTGFVVLTPNIVPYSYLYLATTTDAFASYLTNRAKGSAYPAVTGVDFEEAKLLLPDQAVLQKFHLLAADLLALQQALEVRNANLRHTRDLLLPRLVSGELDVSELEIAGVEELPV